MAESVVPQKTDAAVETSLKKKKKLKKAKSNPSLE